MADSKDWRDWVRYGEDNWLYGLEGLERHPTPAAFQLFEAAEKYLKAALLARGLEPERTHDLKSLLAAVEPGVDAGGLEWAAADLLSRLFPPGRYPGNSPEPTVEEARALAQAAGLLRALAPHAAPVYIPLPTVRRWALVAFADGEPRRPLVGYAVAMGRQLWAVLVGLSLLSAGAASAAFDDPTAIRAVFKHLDVREVRCPASSPKATLCGYTEVERQPFFAALYRADTTSTLKRYRLAHYGDGRRGPWHWMGIFAGVAGQTTFGPDELWGVYYGYLYERKPGALVLVYYGFDIWVPPYN